MSTNHELRLYNWLGRRMEDFVPAAEVAALYSCGPTVYAYPHLGNMRAYVFADTLRRALRWKAIGVRTSSTSPMSGTPSPTPKPARTSSRSRRPGAAVGPGHRRYYTDVFLVDTAALNILPADEYPRASAYVEQMIDFAKKLDPKALPTSCRPACISTPPRTRATASWPR